MVLILRISLCNFLGHLRRRVPFETFSGSLRLGSGSLRLSELFRNLLDLVRLSWKVEVDWRHTGLCKLLENAFAIMVIGLGVCLALHARFYRCSPDRGVRYVISARSLECLCYYSILPLWSSYFVLGDRYFIGESPSL